MRSANNAGGVLKSAVGGGFGKGVPQRNSAATDTTSSVRPPPIWFGDFGYSHLKGVDIPGVTGIRHCGQFSFDLIACLCAPFYFVDLPMILTWVWVCGCGYGVRVRVRGGKGGRG